VRADPAYNSVVVLNFTTGIGIFGSDAGPHPVGPNGCSDGTRECVFLNSLP
jgi:hypothetical protein